MTPTGDFNQGGKAMKKNIITAAFAAASALLLVSSCAKEELRENVNTGDGKVFTAVISQNLTKTTITSEYKVNWEAGDQIYINEAIFSATPDASDATKATFTKVSGSDPVSDYTAVYPASIMVGTQATLPATQTYAAGKFNAPMCAMSSTESLEFKNFCGVLCFALKGTDKVKSIAVTANEQLCGPFEFADATSFSFSGENVGYTVTLDCGEGVQLSSTESTNFYIYLPPATYTSGMKIVATDTEGKTFKKTTTKSAEITKNNIYTFNWTATFAAATKGTAKRTGDIDVPWVQLWKDGPKFAEYNVGVTDGKATSYGGYFTWASDIASTQWGADWRMPTYLEFDALINNCTLEKKTNFEGSGVTGWLCKGKGDYSDNSVFFPAAGLDMGEMGKDDENNKGYYLTSEQIPWGSPYFMIFTSAGSPNCPSVLGASDVFSRTVRAVYTK